MDPLHRERSPSPEHMLLRGEKAHAEDLEGERELERWNDCSWQGSRREGSAPGSEK